MERWGGVGGKRKDAFVKPNPIDAFHNPSMNISKPH